MKYERWLIPETDSSAVDALMDAGYPYLVSTVLSSRGVKTPEEAAEFLDREDSLSISPFLMKDMDKAVERISAAIANGEKIAVFGDYDVDGITSTCLLADYLRGRGAEVFTHIPRRVEEGYGLGCEAIRSLAEQGVTLLITVDCGITGVEETAFAKTLGVDVVVTDHHECKETLPDAVAVVDPHRPDCPYPFKHLAGVGVALKLVLALGGHGREDALFARYCTLAAIGTVADVMRMEGENRVIVHAGLERIDHSDFIGLHALLKETGLSGKPISSVQIGFVLSPRINAAGRMGQADLAAKALLTNDPAEAEELARALCDLNRERQSVEQGIFQKALEQIDTLPSEARNALVLASDEWHQGVVGIVASRLSEKFSCPSFMIHLSDELGKGSCRSYGGFNLFAALEACSDLLVGFGGHELAAGFTIRKENIPAFRKKMNAYVRAHCGADAPVSSLEVDAALLRPSLVTLAEVEELSRLEPYGAGNNRPIFCLKGAILESAQSVGQNKHLKLKLQKSHNSFDGIFFSVTNEDCGIPEGSRVDAAFYLQVNEFRGNRSLQMQLVDIRPAIEPSAREAESIELCRAFLDGEKISPRDASRLLPSREQFVHLWRALERASAEKSLAGYELPLLRSLSAQMPGAESFLRTLLCLRVFSERGLLSFVRSDGSTSISLSAEGKKIELDASPILRSLHDILNGTNRGDTVNG